MKRKMLSISMFFTLFYIFLTAIACACGFLGENYTTEENNGKLTIKSECEEKINVLMDGSVKKLSLCEYLYGVVAAEMPASFEEEALKAQAVAARTEAVKKKAFENKDHKNAAVCDNPSHCQAYYGENALKDKYGEKWLKEDYQKIKKAVDATNGIIATYNNEPITAVFHSTSSGMTENSRDVWGGDMPYLVSVKSEGEEESPRFSEEKEFSFGEFKNLISKSKKITFSDNPKNWITNIKRNESGSVDTLNICGNEFKGTRIRNILSLRSTNFEISVTDKIVFKTKGNGHGVGMSQYGANYMAKKGYGYEDILKKYYTGITIKKIDE